MLDVSPLAAAAASIGSVRLAVLFGSAARDRRRPDSDVDVAVHLDGPEPEGAVYAALSRACQAPLDLVLINDAPPQLRFEICSGILLFERTAGAWRDMKAAAMVDWWDWQDTARRLHASYLARLRARLGSDARGS